MNDNEHTPTKGSFKARLRHYHRTASPSIYKRKQKRWEDVLPSRLGDASLSAPQEAIDLTVKIVDGIKVRD